MRALIAHTRTSISTAHPSPFGASVVDSATGDTIAMAYDSVLRECDPTAHGEVNALRQACAALGRLSLAGTTLYSTCEPCPLCTSAALWAEVDAIVYGAVTAADAQSYWPQASSLRARDVLRHQVHPRPTVLFEEVERPACQALFADVDAARTARALQLPPHRHV